jgi:hypothetical protein
MKCKTCGKMEESATLVELEHPKEIWLCDNCRWHILYTLMGQFIMEMWMPRMKIKKEDNLPTTRIKGKK